MKDIKDYLHLYLGCHVNTVDGVGVNLGHFYPDVWIREGNTESNGILVFFKHISTVYVMNYGQCKLLLRPLSSMTKEEDAEFSATKRFQRATPVHVIGSMVMTPESFRYLLSKHFDLFGLIEEGLAIDLRKPNSEPAVKESDTTNDK